MRTVQEHYICTHHCRLDRQPLASGTYLELISLSMLEIVAEFKTLILVNMDMGTTCLLISMWIDYTVYNNNRASLILLRLLYIGRNL